MTENTGTPHACDIESAILGETNRIHATTADDDFKGEPTRRTTATGLSDKVRAGELEGADALHILTLHGRASRAKSKA